MQLASQQQSAALRQVGAELRASTGRQLEGVQDALAAALAGSAGNAQVRCFYTARRYV